MHFILTIEFCSILKLSAITIVCIKSSRSIFIIAQTPVVIVEDAQRYIYTISNYAPTAITWKSAFSTNSPLG